MINPNILPSAIDDKQGSLDLKMYVDDKTEEKLDMLNQTGVPKIQKAVVILHEMSLDEEVQEMARLREKWILDENSALGNAKRTGIKEGIEKERKDMIEKMRKSGIPEEQIQNILNS